MAVELNLRRSHRSLVRERLQELEIRPSKRLGQNFLVDPDACRRVVSLAGLSGGETVVEIGPGLGALTEHLAVSAAHVIGVELDGRLAEELSVVFSAQTNVEIHHGDALTTDYDALLPANQEVVLVSSLPYSIVGILLATILRSVTQIARLIIVVQREVADKIVAVPGADSYGILALITAFHAQASKVGKISGRSFYPVPDVESAIVQLTRRCPPRVHCGEGFVWKVVNASFGKRRKMIVNSLLYQLDIEKSLLAELLRSVGVSPRVRAETLNMSDFLRIAEVLYDEIHKPQ